LFPAGCKSPAKVLAVTFALPGALTGIDAQPSLAAAKDLVKSSSSRLRQEQKSPKRACQRASR
jgi:hypothetical protein